jgi:hypothetical protein
MMRTRFPASTASEWISSELVPYSSEYYSLNFAAGSLPGLRTGTNPTPSA